MSNINNITLTLISDLNQAAKLKPTGQDETIKTTKTVSDLGFLYEKARNAIEFRDEHLIRQAAIIRILKRRLFLNQESKKITRLLIKELSWAKYFVKNSIESSKTELIEKIINKYKAVLSSIPGEMHEKIIGLCACEIEEKLYFDPLSQILINYVSASLFNHFEIEAMDKQTKSMQIYLAVERAYAKNNEILITYKLLKVLLPKWQNKRELLEVLNTIEKHLNHPIKDILKRKVTSIISPFNLIREIVINNENPQKLIEDQNLLDTIANETLEKRYSETKKRVINASKRSIIYIFLTKMVLAVLVEIPIEIIFNSINYLNLAINIIFPPSLMFLLNMRTNLPDKQNSHIIITKVKEYFYKNEQEVIAEYIRNTKNSTGKNKVFFYLFLVTSILIIMGILKLLNLLDFSLISQIIFLFFLTVVSFFAYRVQEISKEYQLPDESGESFLRSIIDYLFLPIIKVGQFLSNQVSKLNFLSFIFDFIIEAPLKSFLEILEDWLHFVRTKKEEILG